MRVGKGGEGGKADETSAAGPVKPFAVADKTTAATRRYVEER